MKTSVDVDNLAGDDRIHHEKQNSCRDSLRRYLVEAAWPRSSGQSALSSRAGSSTLDPAPTPVNPHAGAIFRKHESVASRRPFCWRYRR